MTRDDSYTPFSGRRRHASMSVGLRRLPWLFVLTGAAIKGIVWLTALWVFPTSSTGEWVLALDPLATWAAQNVVLLFVWNGSFGPTFAERVMFDFVLITACAVECGLVACAGVWLARRLESRAAIT
jgi:hypothetical protein